MLRLFFFRFVLKRDLTVAAYSHPLNRLRSYNNYLDTHTRSKAKRSVPRPSRGELVILMIPKPTVSSLTHAYLEPPRLSDPFLMMIEAMRKKKENDSLEFTDTTECFQRERNLSQASIPLSYVFPVRAPLSSPRVNNANRSGAVQFVSCASSRRFARAPFKVNFFFLQFLHLLIGIFFLSFLCLPTFFSFSFVTKDPGRQKKQQNHRRSIILCSVPGFSPIFFSFRFFPFWLVPSKRRNPSRELRK